MEYLIHVAILVCIYGILALSLDLVVGEAGLLSVAQAAFYGLGAYASALLMVSFGVNFFLAAPLGMTIAGIVALPIGIVFARLREEYYAFGTIGFCVIAYSVMLNWQSLTHGPLGIPGIPRPVLFGFQFADNLAYLALAAVALALTYGVSAFVISSSFGRVLHAIREDEEAIAIFGYATHYYKLVVFVVSAMLAAIAGALFASYITFIDPSSFTLNESIFILAIIILGGLSSARGALLGALLLIVLPEALRFVGFPSDIAAQMRQVVYGLILILLMLFRPQGLLGKFRM
ncbi:MAG: branched-chain amino acid ABC transporter permease [Patescibacteria group bacterium]